jgi:dGTPase
MHDLGHPPFGHNGERALDEKMREFGGFEGNAQTLRIVTRLEKKVLRSNCGPDEDARAGLNLTARTVASILKYDNKIPLYRPHGSAFVKGYYADAEPLLERVKTAVEPNWRDRKGMFKTVECAIMDIADDISYSTYDLEDSLTAGFLTPGSILASDDDLLDRVATKVSKAVGRPVGRTEVLAVLIEVFSGIVGDSTSEPGDFDSTAEFIRAYRASETLARDGHVRTALTAQLVNNMIKAVEVEIDEEAPSLSDVRLVPDALLQVEVLKNYTYEATIFSTRVKVAEYRGHDLVATIFDALADAKGSLLMPDDIRLLYQAQKGDDAKQRRVVCDFVAGMTDRYAIEFYGRLHSDDGQSIFKPVG